LSLRSSTPRWGGLALPTGCEAAHFFAPALVGVIMRRRSDLKYRPIADA
jgi:hypothetical protein